MGEGANGDPQSNGNDASYPQPPPEEEDDESCDELAPAPVPTAVPAPVLAPDPQPGDEVNPHPHPDDPESDDEEDEAAILPPAPPAPATTPSLAPAVMPICTAYKGSSFEKAKGAYPDIKDAIEAVETYDTAAWYTDNAPESDRFDMLDAIVAGCGKNTKIPIVVYGLAQKDCEAGNVTVGSVRNPEMYKKFIGELTKRFPTQHMIYIVEPGALALIPKRGCGVAYLNPLRYVISELGKNPHAEIFLDASHWARGGGKGTKLLVQAVETLWKASGKASKGIALNTRRRT